ncbi:hypothetical protein IE81DRAFT_346811 [Ceraceosorus guamensis]|uniref:Uncharacterized protein n=1 Tax=Ceraceosorus guamensis TaxID=1522189 RepID=A0A316W047_9BASI|nr:hypothetical protein IE81DRAFT_346811 [Ceraceosorus guamensis]PWN43216.1 hypothetical protein IE81DRAFT_346811 [Ceraceosorus guamensis]
MAQEPDEENPAEASGHGGHHASHRSSHHHHPNYDDDGHNRRASGGWHHVNLGRSPTHRSSHGASAQQQQQSGGLRRPTQLPVQNEVMQEQEEEAVEAGDTQAQKSPLMEGQHYTEHSGVPASAATSHGYRPSVGSHNTQFAYGGEAASSQQHLVGSGARHGPAQQMTVDQSKQSVFDMAHGKKDGDAKDHIDDINEKVPIRMSHLFKRPLVRQWLYDGQLYRECDEREPSRFELFFDLVFVGVCHALADGAAEHANGLNVLKFVLAFFPAWSIWTDTRAYINTSGTDDVWQRVYILLIMILLSGYAANATGVKIEPYHGAEAGHGESATGGEASHDGQSEGSGVVIEAPGSAGGDGGETHSVERRVVDFAVRGGITLLARAGGGEGPELEVVRQIGNSQYWFAEGYHKALQAAIGFYLVAKLFRLALLFVYGLLLPRFRKAMWLNTISLVFIAFIYLPLMFVTSPRLILGFSCAGVVAELSSRYVVAAALQMAHGKAKHAGKKTFIPALSLEHLMERMTLFVILVTGEILIVSSYTASGGDIGPHDKFWRSALAITIAFSIIWLYFDADASRTFVHALRRHWLHSISWTHVHFPLCAALILLASALAKLVGEHEVEQGFLWFFAGSMSTVMVCFGLLGLLHGSLDVYGSSLVPHWWRIAQRFGLAIAFALFPLHEGWTSVGFLGTYAALLVIQVFTETFGKLGAVGRVYDHERAEALREARSKAHQDSYSSTSQRIASGGSGTSSDKEIPMERLTDGAGGEKRRASQASESRWGMGHGRNPSELLHLSRKLIDKDYAVRAPGKRDSWHAWEDLTGEEIGEEDVGVESQLGNIEAKHVSSGQRWAYAAT